MNDDGKVAAVGGGKDIFLTINGKWFSHLTIFSKPVGGAIQAFHAIVRWRSDVMARQELDAFIRSALEILPQRTASTEDARAVLIAEGIITAEGELAAQYRPAGDRGKLQGKLPPHYSSTLGRVSAAGHLTLNRRLRRCPSIGPVLPQGS
jgi:hypothetical protein